MALEFVENGPLWIHNLIRSVSESVCPLGFIGQLGFRYLAPDGIGNTTQRWLIGIYLVPTELSGGNTDGAIVLPGFSIDLLNLTRLFSDIKTLEWKVPRGYTDGLAGPEVWLEGTYCGTEFVQLHIYADCPADEVPALVLNVTTNTLHAK